MSSGNEWDLSTSDLTEEELLEERRINNAQLHLLAEVIKRSRNSYDEDVSSMISALKFIDDSSPIVYSAISRMDIMLNMTIYDENYDALIQLINNSIS